MNLSTVDVIEDEVEFLLRLERRVERHEERVVLVVAQDVAFGHDVVSLIAAHHRALLEHLDGEQGRIDVAARQQHFAEAAAAQHAEELEIARLQPSLPNHNSITLISSSKINF